MCIITESSKLNILQEDRLSAITDNYSTLLFPRIDLNAVLNNPEAINDTIQKHVIGKGGNHLVVGAIFICETFDNGKPADAAVLVPYSNNTTKTILDYEQGKVSFSHQIDILRIAAQNQILGVPKILGTARISPEDYDQEKFFGLIMERLYPLDTINLSMENIISIACALGKTLHEMHEHSVAHLDIKPDNIMQDSNGEVVLVDWDNGSINGSRSEKFEPNTIATTLQTASPEQLFQTGGIPQLMDIHALGMTIYFLLCGINLSNTENSTPSFPSGWLHLHERDMLQMQEDTKLTTEILTVLQRATSFEPQARYQSIMEFINELQGAYQKSLTSDAKMNKTAPIPVLATV